MIQDSEPILPAAIKRPANLHPVLCAIHQTEPAVLRSANSRQAHKSVDLHWILNATCRKCAMELRHNVLGIKSNPTVARFLFYLASRFAHTLSFKVCLVDLPAKHVPVDNAHRSLVCLFYFLLSWLLDFDGPLQYNVKRSALHLAWKLLVQAKETQVVKYLARRPLFHHSAPYCKLS